MKKKGGDSELVPRDGDPVRYGTSFRISPEAHQLAKFVSAAKRTTVSGLLNKLIIESLTPVARSYSKKFLDGGGD